MYFVHSGNCSNSLFIRSNYAVQFFSNALTGINSFTSSGNYASCEGLLPHCSTNPLVSCSVCIYLVSQFVSVYLVSQLFSVYLFSQSVCQCVFSQSVVQCVFSQSVCQCVFGQSVCQCVISVINIYYSFDTGEYHESVGLVFTRVPQARA